MQTVLLERHQELAPSEVRRVPAGLAMQELAPSEVVQDPAWEQELALEVLVQG